MALGHFMMTQEPLFYVALATIAIGNGLFLPSLPSQIRDLYQPGDPRAGRAYNVYYVGVNIGGFLAMLVCGALGETFGWHWGFGAAGVGMVTGLLFYLWGQRYLPAQSTAASHRATRRASRKHGARHAVAALRPGCGGRRVPQCVRAGRQHRGAVGRYRRRQAGGSNSRSR